MSTQPTSDQIKSVRRAIRPSYNTTDAKEEWEQIYNAYHLDKAYGLDPNKNNSKIGKAATTHILDSAALRDELSEHTPIDHPPIIPADCHLNFFYSFHTFHHRSLCPALNLSQRFENVDKMRNIFDDRLYTSKLIITIAGTDHEFWVKSIKQSGTAFVRAFGVQVSSYIMRYRPVIYVQLGPIIMALRAKNIGVGFCNLTADTIAKGITGHQMIHLEAETMEQVFIEFYATNGITIQDISLKVMTYQQKKKKLIPKRNAPLILFDGTKYLHFEGTVTTARDANQDRPQMNGSSPPCRAYPREMSASYASQSVFPVLDTQSLYMDTAPNPFEFPIQSTDFMDQSTIYDSNHSITPSLYSHDALSPMSFAMHLPNLSMKPNTDADELYDASKPQRTFQDMNGFNDPRNGIHRRMTRYERKDERSQFRYDAHMDEMRSPRIDPPFLNLPKFDV